MSLIAQIDTLIRPGGAFMPYWGWHDDHRHLDGTPDYRPALQQVREEYDYFVEGLQTANLLGQGHRCLQLGMGECMASHRAWQVLFDHVLTIDWGCVAIDDDVHPSGLDTHSPDALALAREFGPFDLAFLDAGHLADDARRDHEDYGSLVSPGGVLAWHDALRRPGFEDAVTTWRYLETLDLLVHVIGYEVGIAWMRM